MADGYGASRDQARPDGAVWQVRGTEDAQTFWVGRDDKESDYRDSATYWDVDPNAPGGAATC